jgi:hypothetical protein
VASGRDSGGLGGGIVAPGRAGGLGGGIVAPKRAGGLGGGIVAPRRAGGLGGGIVAPRRDSSGAGGGIKGFGCVCAFVGRGTRLLDGILGSNSCNAFLFLY